MSKSFLDLARYKDKFDTQSRFIVCEDGGYCDMEDYEPSLFTCMNEKQLQEEIEAIVTDGFDHRFVVFDLEQKLQLDFIFVKQN